MSGIKKPLPLPSGLSLHRYGESLEAIASKAIEVKLLVSGQGIEIHEGALKRGERITLASAGHAVETYYLLAGELTDGVRTLNAGDYVVTERLLEPYTLSALSEVRFLYLSSSPTFHTVSRELGELMKLAVEVEVRDGYTAEHCSRLQALSYATGQELGLSPAKLYLLDYGAYLHDVGKVKVPLDILQKPSALSDQEWRLIKQHPIFGRELLETTYLKEAGTIVEQHHERSDGSGYPYGLAGDDILVEASVVAVADTYDAMTTDRPYRRALSSEDAFRELKRYAGLHYPKEVVTAFILALSKQGEVARSS